MTRSSLLALLLIVGSGAHGALDSTTNQKGRLTSVGNGATRTFYQYDAQGRPIATQSEQDGQVRIFTTVYAYPQNAQSTAGPGTVVQTQIFPDGERVTYSYDLSGMQVAVRSTLGAASDDILRDVRKNARGQVTSITLGNGVVTTFTYDEGQTLRLQRVVAKDAGGTTIQDYTYTYDANGNVTGTADGVRPDQSATYEYDSLDQLTAFRNSGGSVLEQYGYDSIGNLTQKGSLTQTYGAGGRPHALQTSAGVSYGYDANGNVLTIGSNTTIEWNAENMPTKMTAGNVVTEKSFVGESVWKKVEQGVTTYYLPSLRVENGQARKYYGTFAERVESPGDRQLRFYHPDHLGSSSVMTDQSGAVIRRATYFPWGQDRGVEGTFTPKLQFHFKEKDAAGFYDFGARLYSPITGRWLSPDSTVATGLNRYAYANNNPWSRTDPSGHEVKRLVWLWCKFTLANGMIKHWVILYPDYSDEETWPKGWTPVPMENGQHRMRLEGMDVVLYENGTAQQVFEATQYSEASMGPIDERAFLWTRSGRTALNRFGYVNQQAEENPWSQFGRYTENFGAEERLAAFGVLSVEGTVALATAPAAVEGVIAHGIKGAGPAIVAGAVGAHQGYGAIEEIIPFDSGRMTALGFEHDTRTWAMGRTNHSQRGWNDNQHQMFLRKILDARQPVMVLSFGDEWTSRAVQTLIQNDWNIHLTPDGILFTPAPIVDSRIVGSPK